MESVSEAQFLNVTFLLLLLAAALTLAVFAADIFPLTRIYTSKF